MSGVLCVIPARGGSKRIPRKNIRGFCGKPIIAYSIEAAIESGIFSEVMVSTDDEEIAAIAAQYGAAVPFMRSNEASSDHATTSDVLLEVLAWYANKGTTFDVLCCVYPTAPFVTASKLREGFAMLDHFHDSVVSGLAFSFPPQRGYVIRDGIVHWREPRFRDCRSQDLEPVYHDAGQFYFLTTEALASTKSLLGESAILYEVPETEAQDIDNESDWALAEMKYERMVAARG